MGGSTLPPMTLIVDTYLHCDFEGVVTD